MHSCEVEFIGVEYSEVEVSKCAVLSVCVEKWSLRKRRKGVMDSLNA